MSFLRGAHAACNVRKHEHFRTRTITHYITLVLQIMFSTLPYVCSNVSTNDCQSCAVHEYAAVAGSAMCSPCGSGTFLFVGSSNCMDCNASIFSSENAYLGNCSVKKTSFQLQSSDVRNNNTDAFMYNGPENVTWFNVAFDTISVRDLLNSVKKNWTTGTQVRIQSALGQPRVLNPVVLQRIGTGHQGVWSPANMNPIHTRNSARYYIINWRVICERDTQRLRIRACIYQQHILHTICHRALRALNCTFVCENSETSG